MKAAKGISSHGPNRGDPLRRSDTNAFPPSNTGAGWATRTARATINSNVNVNANVNANMHGLGISERKSRYLQQETPGRSAPAPALVSAQSEAQSRIQSSRARDGKVKSSRQTQGTPTPCNSSPTEAHKRAALRPKSADRTRPQLPGSADTNKEQRSKPAPDLKQQMPKPQPMKGMSAS